VELNPDNEVYSKTRKDKSKYTLGGGIEKACFVHAWHLPAI